GADADELRPGAARDELQPDPAVRSLLGEGRRHRYPAHPRGDRGPARGRRPPRQPRRRLPPPGGAARRRRPPGGRHLLPRVRQPPAHRAHLARAADLRPGGRPRRLPAAAAPRADHPARELRPEPLPLTVTSLLVRRARLVPVASRRGAPSLGGAVVDVRVTDGRVVEVGPGLAAGGEELDADGRWLVPGLWDQHVPSSQWARSFTRIDLTTARSAADAVETVRAAVAARPPAPGALVEGYGFRDALWPDLPTTTALDRAAPGVAVVLVSGDVHCGWLSTAAMRQLRVAPRDGLVREHEWFDVLAAIGRLPQSDDDGLRAAMAAAASRGVVGVADMEFAANHRVWPERVAAGLDALRVRTGVYTDDLDDVLAAGLRTGDPLPGGRGLLTMGPVKVISDGALNTRTAFCHEPYTAVGADAGAGAGHGEQTVPPAELRELMHRAAGAGLATAVHAIGDAAVTIVLDAYEATGARG